MSPTFTPAELLEALASLHEDTLALADAGCDANPDYRDLGTVAWLEEMKRRLPTGATQSKNQLWRLNPRVSAPI